MEASIKRPHVPESKSSKKPANLESYPTAATPPYLRNAPERNKGLAAWKYGVNLVRQGITAA
jgi:hypothetical protein